VPKSAETHETLLLWRKRVRVGGAVHELKCSLDHLGEGLFELHLQRGHDLLLNESFDDTESLLRRAAELRSPIRLRAT
jgi:hypothetical protein